MDRSFLRSMVDTQGEKLLGALLDHQHLHPRAPLGSALESIAGSVGFCKFSAHRAIEWLKLDPSLSIGRLRRTELTQLARCIHRFWRQAVAHSTGQNAVH